MAEIVFILEKNLEKCRRGLKVFLFQNSLFPFMNFESFVPAFSEFCSCSLAMNNNSYGV